MKTKAFTSIFLSILLVLTMCLSMLPISVFAAGVSNGVITLTPADLVDGASGEGWSFDGDLTIDDGYRLVFEGECSVDVENWGTIENGIFNTFVYNRGTIEDGTFNNQVENNMGTIRGGNFYASVKNTAIGATIAGGSFHGDVTNYRTITGGTFLSTVENLMGTISGGTFAGKLTNNQGSISGITIELSNALIQGGTSYGWSLDDENILHLNNDITFYWKDGEECSEYLVMNNGTIFGGTISGDVENNGTISGGTFSGDVENNGTISGGEFTGSLSNAGPVTGTTDLSKLQSLNNSSGGLYGKDVKLPQAEMNGTLTYIGCDSSTPITLEYHADGSKASTFTVSGADYSYAVACWKRTDPNADISGIAEIITHEVKAVSMNGYEVTVTKADRDRFDVTVTRDISISSIEKTGTNGLVDTYTITYTDGTTSTFTVTNGAQGEQGIQGEKGDKGDSGIAGADGKDGVDGKDGADGLTVAATVIGSTALVSNISLIAYALIKRKRLF